MATDLKRLKASIPAMSPKQRTQLEANIQNQMTKGTDAQKELAAAALQILEQVRARELDELSSHVERLPMVQRIIEAFTYYPPTDTDVTVIRALLSHPNSSSSELSAVCGWKGVSWHVHFGKMCDIRRPRLWPANKYVQGGIEKDFLSGILATFDDETQKFTMKPEAVETFKVLKLA